MISKPPHVAGGLALAAFAAFAAAVPAAPFQVPPRPAAAPSASPSPSPGPSPEPVPEAPESPRASVRQFMELTTRRGDYQSAARYLALPAGEEKNGSELARRLRAVLERRLNVDLDTISPAAEGSGQDDLPPGVDVIGEVVNDAGGHDKVFLVRSRDADGAYWAFSRQTVAHIDGWYDALPDRWVRDWMPERLQRYGPGQLMWWQWLALPALLLVALAAGRVLGAATAGVLRRLARRTRTRWDDLLLARVSPALTLLWAMVVAALLLPRLALLPAAHAYARSAFLALASFAVFWSLWRSVDVWTQFLMARPWAATNASARSLVSVARNLARVLIALGGVLATLAALGYPATTVLAGLGIGGIALAFGAQKTIEHLFGSIAIATDQPFRVGDFVRIEDFTGHVERVGMRSTQIRTLDRTLITLPNGRLADMRIEDFGSRDRIRLVASVGLVYGTSEAQLRRVVAGIEELLRAEPRTWQDAVVVKLAGLGPSSLDIDVICWFLTQDYDEFRALRQEALLGILRIVEQAGTSVAFPTRTVHVVGATDGGTEASAATRDQREK